MIDPVLKGKEHGIVDWPDFGAVGDNVAGGFLKNHNHGAIVNSIADIAGGGVGGGVVLTSVGLVRKAIAT